MNIKFRNLFQQDIDQVFSYHTAIEVVILDRYIGIIYRLLQLAVIIFFLYSVYLFFCRNSIFYFRIVMELDQSSNNIIQKE